MNSYFERYSTRILQFALLAIMCSGCNLSSAKPLQTLIIATTTSTRDSGLMDALVPVFEAQTGVQVKVIAVGSGQALELGRRGDADLLLTHSPFAEAAFMEQGFGDTRHPVMYNDFVLVGPLDDPADVKSAMTVKQSLERIAEKQVPFVSRGDESGTHVKEKLLWGEISIELPQAWYIQSGNGMAATLRIASEKQGYTLSDRGTFLAQQQSLKLGILLESHPPLHNPYTVITVNPKVHPHVQHQAAQQFAEFLLSEEARRIITTHGVQEFGQPLFFIENPAN